MSASPRILITGATGFVGPHLTTHLKKSGYSQFWGTTRKTLSSVPDALKGVALLTGDLMRPETVDHFIMEANPDWLIHLAGHAEVSNSWATPTSTLTTNVFPLIHILDAIRKQGKKTRVLVIGSSEEYGHVNPAESPLHENTPLRPVSPYAVSKVAQDMTGYQYFMTYGIPVLRTRSFNHTGPGRQPQYAVSNFCRQIARIELKKQSPVIKVGNLSAERDYLDVRDVVQAYRLLLEKGTPGEVYNVCSDTSRSLQSIVEDLTRLATTRVSFEVDPTRLRPSDSPRICGDSKRLRKATGWTPAIPFEQTLRELLAYWREKEASA